MLGKIGLVSLVALVAALPSYGASSPAKPWSITELGTLGGSWGDARDINNRGQAVGWSDTALGTGHAFLWEDAALRDLGTLDGDVRSVAEAINDHGQIVGVSRSAAGTERAFLWERGEMTAIGPSGLNSSASDVNNHGQVVGHVYSPSYQTRAFLWEDGVTTYLAPTDVESVATGINDAGLIVGYARVPETHAVVWQAGAMIDLGVLSDGHASSAWAINARGQVAGGCNDSHSPRRACIWEREVISDLGSFPDPGDAWANDINNRGQVVGWSSHPDHRAVLWEDSHVTELGTLPGPGRSEATAVNDAGLVVGSSWVMETSQVIGPRPVIWSRTAAMTSDPTGGTNIALGSSVTASATWSHPGFEPTRAVDGDYYTYWSAGDFAPQWIEIDLGRTCLVSAVVAWVTMLPDGLTEQEILVRGDQGHSGDAYATAASYADHTIDSQRITFTSNGPGGQATAWRTRYVKVVTWQSPSWIAWREIEVYGRCPAG